MGDRRVGWRSIEYPRVAGRAWTPERRRSTYRDGLDAWETMIRHVVEALCSLERTGTDAFADPYVRMPAKAEIIGPWLTHPIHGWRRSPATAAALR